MYCPYMQVRIPSYSCRPVMAYRPVTAYTATQPIMVNGYNINTGLYPVLNYKPDTAQYPYIYVPIAEFSRVGAKVFWDNDKQLLTVTTDYYTSKSPNSYIQTNVFPENVSVASALKSNDTINNTAQAITQNATTKEAKARLIYDYVGSHLTHSNTGYGGAIGAYSNSKGTAYDYSVLYTVMANAAGLNVRLIGGRGNIQGIPWGSDYFINPDVNYTWVEIQLDNANWIAISPYIGGSAGWNFPEGNVGDVRPTGAIPSTAPANAMYPVMLYAEFINY